MKTKKKAAKKIPRPVKINRV